MLGEYARSQGGASLTASFSLLTLHPTFKAHVLRNMTYEERLRLFALHEQAVHGDAPGVADAPREEEAAKAKGTAGAEAAAAPTAVTAAATRWFDFAAKAKQRRWESLRGTMTPQVARETFCAEFLALLEKYPSRELIPLVEAALSRAQALQSGEASAPSKAGRGGGRAKQQQQQQQEEGEGEGLMLVFCIRAFQDDPAAMAMLWICRAYGVPCEITVEPLAKALALPGSCRRPRQGAGEEGADLFYATAAAASLAEGRLTVPFYAGVRRGPRFIAEVSSPEAGFELLCDTFLSRMSHWAGLTSPQHHAKEERGLGAGPRTSPSMPAGAPEEADGVPAGERLLRARQAAERAEWLDDLTSITCDVRSPIMGLLIEEAVCLSQKGAAGDGESKAVAAAAAADSSEGTEEVRRQPQQQQPSSSLAGRRCPQLRVVAARLNRFQRTFIRRKVQRSAFNRTAADSSGLRGSKPAAAPLCPPLLDSDAAVRVIDAFYRANSHRRLVSCVDVYVACCGYVLCTNPLSQRLFTKLNSEGCEEAGWLATRPSAFASAAATAAAAVDPRSRGFAAVRLPGMPADYNEMINSVLRRESRSALPFADAPAPVPSLHTVSSSSSSSSDTANALAAADAIERYMLAQMLSLNVDDIEHKAAGGAPRAPAELVDGALTPFVALAHVFTGAWALAQRQCTGFPFLLLSAQPARQVSFLWEGNATHSEAMGGAGSLARRGSRGVLFHAVPEDQLGQESFGVDSWESRLREVGWSVVARILSSANPAREPDAAAGPHRRTYSTDGRTQAKL